MNLAFRTLAIAAVVLVAGSTTTSLAFAVPAQYTIDPQHTYPSFEVP
jgi:polyisoprenoid-binding protein YceI